MKQLKKIILTILIIGLSIFNIQAQNEKKINKIVSNTETNCEKYTHLTYTDKSVENYVIISHIYIDSLYIPVKIEIELYDEKENSHSKEKYYFKEKHLIYFTTIDKEDNLKIYFDGEKIKVYLNDKQVKKFGNFMPSLRSKIEYVIGKFYK